jgi:apolipoprotein N-acyltransferase
MIPRDMVPGTGSGVLDVAGTRLGDLICFEVAYDDLVRDLVDDGADLLVVQTNNATYMGTGQVEQQFAIARLRALETGRWVVVVATNGVSGVVDPAGRVAQRAPVREQAVLEQTVPLVRGRTPAMRVGGAVDLGLAAVAVLAVAAGVATGRRRARAGPPAGPPAGAAEPTEPRPAEPSGTGR